jgi:hypothetical protein
MPVPYSPSDARDLDRYAQRKTAGSETREDAESDVCVGGNGYSELRPGFSFSRNRGLADDFG